MPQPENQPNTPGRPETSGRGVWLGLLAMALVGLILAAKLTDEHVRVYTDPGYRGGALCTINAALNCYAVAQSRWSVMLGLPVSVWGLLGYAAMVLVSVWGLRRGRGAAAAMLLLASAAVVISAGLAAISVAKIHTLCPFCMGTYAVDLVVFVLALAVVRRGGGLSASLRGLYSRAGRLSALILAGVGVVAMLMAWYPKYWKKARPIVDLPTGVDASGSHWIGAAEPRLTIVEFSDYQCPHCQRGHELVRALVTTNPTTIRIVHRHFPLDQRCNPSIGRAMHDQACRDAALAICAGDQHRFWAANDYLFEHNEGVVDVRDLAADIGVDPAALQRCLDEKKYQARLDADVQTGISFQIDGTPTYFVNGTKYQGHIPEEVLKPYLHRPR